jgi:FkbM family methyltransferase
MLNAAYAALLRLPRFKGRARIEALLRRRLEPGATEVAPGIRMQLDPIDWLQTEMLSGNPPEPMTRAYYRHALSAGDTFIDVGANVGLHSLTAAQIVGPSGSVLSIEPLPYNCDRILTNCRINGLSNVTVIVAAAGDTDRFVTLHDQLPTDKARLSVQERGVNDTRQRFTVPQRTVAALIREQNIEHIHLLKIDVEGNELAVLRGCNQCLDQIDQIVVELLPENRQRDTIVALLKAAGFVLSTINGQPWSGADLPEHNLLASRH